MHLSMCEYGIDGESLPVERGLGGVGGGNSMGNKINPKVVPQKDIGFSCMENNAKIYRTVKYY